MKTCDLHTHSVFSDGTFTPQEIIIEAARSGLSAVALTDHNTIAGLPAFLSAAAQTTVTAIAGVEITADYQGKEIHILGLFLKEHFYDQLEPLLAKIRAQKMQTNKDACHRLLAAGYQISPENIMPSQEECNVNRVHFAKELVRCGYASSIDEAFENILAEELGLYRSSPRVDGFEVLRLLQRIGAVSVLAHPFLNLTEPELCEFLPEAKKHGLIGMETRYSLFTAEESALADQLAEEFGLLPSGGSDFHGDAKPKIRLGVGHGDLSIPLAYCETLAQIQ